jgi:ribosomal protein L21E
MGGKINLNVDVIEQATKTMRESIDQLTIGNEVSIITNTTMQSSKHVTTYLSELTQVTGKIQNTLHAMVDKVEASKTKVVNLDQKLAGK